MKIDFILDNSDGLLFDLVRFLLDVRFWILEVGMGFFVGEVLCLVRLVRLFMVEEGCRVFWFNGFL